MITIDSVPTRALHLIDADNLIGDPRTTDQGLVEAVFDQYRDTAGFIEGDLAVVATGANGLHVLTVECAWPGARHLRRAGADGADRALLEEVSWICESGRFHRVVIGSGDRIFLDALDRLLDSGIDVSFVARARSIAPAMRVRAGAHIRFMPTPSVTRRRVAVCTSDGARTDSWSRFAHAHP